MKKFLSNILFFIAIIFIQCNSAYAAIVKISPAIIDLSAVGVGGTFDVKVEAEDVYDLAAFEFTINYPLFLSVTDKDVLLGDFLGSTGRTVTNMGAAITGGNLNYGTFSTGTNFGPEGNGVLASITFKVISQADGTLKFNKSELLTSKSRPIFHTKSGAKIICSSCNDICSGDINVDNVVDLKDAILILKILCSISISEQIKVTNCTDINGDGKIGFEEALYILQKITNIK